MNVTLNQPLLRVEQNDNRRISKNVQMQTFGYTVPDDDELTKEDVPMATRKFLRYTNGIEAYLQTFPSFSPDHWAVFSWRFFVCFFVIVYFYLIPIFMFFGYEIITENLTIEKIAVFLYIMIFFLLIDIFISLNTGYFDKGHLVIDKHSIFVRYVTQEFAFDVIAVTALILQVAFRDIYAFLIWVPYCFYFKYYYVTLVDLQIVQVLQVQRKLRAVYQILKLILTVLFLVNLFACLFYAAGDYWINQRDDYGSWLVTSGLQNNIYSLPISVKYEYSFYWALTTMLTVGYGDVTGKNPLEIFVSIVTMIFACVIFAMIVSAFQNVFSEITHHNMQFDKKMTDINRFMKDKNIDQETQQRVRRFFSFMFSEKVRDFNEQIQIINQLGPQLKDEVIMQSYGLIFKRTFWTNQFSLDFQRKVAYLVSEQMYCDGEMIFKQNLCSINGNNDDDCLYCVSIGHVVLFLQFDDQDMTFYEAQQNAIFGELGFLTGNVRTLSAKSTTISQLYQLKRSDFISLLQQFPLDFQYYCQLRDQLQFGQFNLVDLNCFCCQSSNHLANECPKSHYYPNKILLVGRIMNQKNNRQQFKRQPIRRDNLNLLRIQKAQQQVKQELSIAHELDDFPELGKSCSFNMDLLQDSIDQISEPDLNRDYDIVNEIVNRLQQKKKSAYVEIDVISSFKNYFPKFNADYIIQHFRKERRITKAFTCHI